MQTEPTPSDVTLTIPGNWSGLYTQSQNVEGHMEVNDTLVSPLIRCSVSGELVDCRRTFSISGGMARSGFSVHVALSRYYVSLVRVEAYLPPNYILKMAEVMVAFGK